MIQSDTTAAAANESSGIDWNAISATAWDKTVEYGPKILLVIIVLFVGLRLIKMLMKVVRKRVAKKTDDETLPRFLSNLLSWVLKIVLFISVASMFGVETTSFIAILGAAGLAIGLALQGTLANFAGGVLLLMFKPYTIGDLIEAQGEKGVVKDIQIFFTVLTTPTQETIILPNGAVMNGNISNFTTEGQMRMDVAVGISYDADIKLAKDTLLDMLKSQEEIFEDPAPMVVVTDLGDSSVNLSVRGYVLPEDYWTVFHRTVESSKEVLDKVGVNIPYPHVTVLQGS